MKRSATRFLLLATSAIATCLILAGVIVPRTLIGDNENYLASLERQDVEFVKRFPSDDKTEWKRYAEELRSRKVGIENLTSIIISIGKSLVGFGIAILICQLLILRSLTNLSSQDEPGTPTKGRPEKASPSRRDTAPSGARDL